MKIEVTSQTREMLLFLTTKMAAVTSPANQKYRGSLFIISKNIQEHKPSMLANC